MKKAIIADIQRCSVHDGPGIRTTVFFKGCPLNCSWCHNPECINPLPELLYYPEKCIRCGKCDCGCFSGAKQLCGKEYDTGTLLRQILLDKDYYGTDGGVTFSGGEPMLYADFIKEEILLCKKEGIGTAIETSMLIYDAELFSLLNVIMADIKIWDNQRHIEYTGVPNIDIIENFKKLDKLGVPIIARTPYIPEIEQNIEKISHFCSQLNNVIKYEILPYHPLGLTKSVALGKPQKRFCIPTKEQLSEVTRYAFVR